MCVRVGSDTVQQSSSLLECLVSLMCDAVCCSGHSGGPGFGTGLAVGGLGGAALGGLGGYMAGQHLHLPSLLSHVSSMCV